MRKGAGDQQGVVGRHERLALEEAAAERGDLRLGPVGEIGDRALEELGAVAHGLAEENGGWRFAIGHALDVQGFILSY